MQSIRVDGVDSVHCCMFPTLSSSAFPCCGDAVQERTLHKEEEEEEEDPSGSGPRVAGPGLQICQKCKELTRAWLWLEPVQELGLVQAEVPASAGGDLSQESRGGHHLQQNHPFPWLRVRVLPGLTQPTFPSPSPAAFSPAVSLPDWGPSCVPGPTWGVQLCHSSQLVLQVGARPRGQQSLMQNCL